MKIGILNECFLSEKHLSRLKTLGEVIVFNDTKTKQEAMEFMQKQFNITVGEKDDN